jgi:UDP-N-acetylglucosamine diphosphorylase / glucose-1-phosphate thymidylyltransferase / UDP-N-acetylgalactosamine diphosphorylase / glucosamine-1-phosphate N-acetyltransferase / galactosamine-1-phosphate N-acetyltransferase
MSELALYLYDDAVAIAWQPFTLTRPAGELLLGAYTFRARAERIFGTACRGHVTAEHLNGFEEPGGAPVVTLASIPTSSGRLFVSSRALLDWAQEWHPPTAALTLNVNGELVGCYVPAGAPNPDPTWFEAPSRLGGGADVELKGGVLTRAWDLIAENAAQITRDFHGSIAGPSAEPPTDAIGYTRGAFRRGEGVAIEPGVVLDFTGGPIWLADGVTVRAFTRLAGPAYVGPDSTLLGGSYTAISVGPVCKVHGEMEEVVVLGYSNKAHDGFLGHAYLGRWVNLGAMTTNSDLKNNYGPIRMWTPEGEQNTGLIKLGSLLGDYVKTGIGALLNTGTVIGAGSNLYGTEMPPKYVPPFSWGSGADLTAFDADKFLQVTETVMERRSLKLSESMRAMLQSAWRLGRNTL